MSALLPVVRSLLSGEAPAVPSPPPAAPEGAVTWETVQEREENGRYRVRGRALATVGAIPYRPGDRVPVLWQDGAPRVILGHSWRRAQFGPSLRLDAQGIVEELAISNLDARGANVWYRNHEKTVKLDVLRFLGGHAPQVVKWGYDGNSFAVQCAEGWYAVFALDREDPNVVSTDAPGEPVFVAISKPLDSPANLATVTYQVRSHVKNVEFYGKTVLTVSYVWIESWMHPKGGYWYPVTGSLTAEWETDFTSEAAASAGTSKSFPLKDVLAGSIADWYGHHRVHGSVLDWFLGSDRHVYFVIRVDWDYFWVGTDQQGSATYTARWGYRPEDVGQVTIHTGAGGVGVIGAKTLPALGGQTVPESHLFLFDGTTGSVVWASAHNDAQFGNTAEETRTRLFEHNITIDPGSPDGFYPPSHSESYYGGANWTNTPQGTITKEAGVIGDGAAMPYSSTGTHQLLSPASCPFVSGPFVSVQQNSVYETFRQIIGAWGHYWLAKFGIQNRSLQRLWHYRMASAQVFQANTEARLFLVVERYPFIAGTGYINDVPQVGVFVVRADGSLVQALRGFQFGLASASLVTGNAHRLFWMLRAIGSPASYRHTDLDTGEEVGLSPAQVQALLSGTPRAFSPDFVWDRLAPETFYLIQALPSLEADDGLAEFARLAPADLPEGDVRIVNDAELLAPLGRYRAA